MDLQEIQICVGANTSAEIINGADAIIMPENKKMVDGTMDRMSFLGRLFLLKSTAHATQYMASNNPLTIKYTYCP